MGTNMTFLQRRSAEKNQNLHLETFPGAGGESMDLPGVPRQLLIMIRITIRITITTFHHVCCHAIQYWCVAVYSYTTV